MRSEKKKRSDIEGQTIKVNESIHNVLSLAYGLTLVSFEVSKVHLILHVTFPFFSLKKKEKKTLEPNIGKGRIDKNIVGIPFPLFNPIYPLR